MSTTHRGGTPTRPRELEGHNDAAAIEIGVLGRPAEGRRFVPFSLPYSPGRILGAEARAKIGGFATNGLWFSRGRSGPHRCRIVPRSGRRARRMQPLVRSGLATDCTPLHSHLLPAGPQPAPAPRPRRRAPAQMGGCPPRAWRRRGPTGKSAHPPTPDLLESAAPSPTCHSVQAPRQPRRRGPKCPQVDSHADRTQLTTVPPCIHECGRAR